MPKRKLAIGDRVEATDAAYDTIFSARDLPVRGVVTGFSEALRRRHHLLVKVDGTDSSESYHPIFWARAEEGA